MPIESINININNKDANLCSLIMRSLQRVGSSTLELFEILAIFLDQVKNHNLLDLNDPSDFADFEAIINLAGVVPYTHRGSRDLSLREMNPALSEKIFTLMLKLLKDHPNHLHKGTAYHNLGAAQFSNQNTNSALMNINEALRSDYYISNGNLTIVKSCPAYKVLTEDLKRISLPTIQAILDNYNQAFQKNRSVEELFSQLNRKTRKGFLLALFFHEVISNYHRLVTFEEETFPQNNLRIPHNYYLLIMRFNCHRGATMLFEEILRNVVGRPRQTSDTLKYLTKNYLIKRGKEFKSTNKLLDLYWGKRNSKKNFGLANFGWKENNKIVLVNSKVNRLLKGNKTKLNNSPKGQMLRAFLMSGLIRNYTNHHLDIYCKAVKERDTFNKVFQMCTNAILFVLFEEDIC